MRMDFRQASVILIPAYNAEAYLSSILKALLPLVPPEKIVVIDDGSQDKTQAVARSVGVTCLRHEKNLGKGSALMTGLLWAREQGWAWAITMDADGQHAPADLLSFWNSKITDDVGILVGHRSIKGTSMPLHRRLSNTLTTYMISALAGRPIYDAQSGFRMYRIAAVSVSAFPRYGRFEWEAQALVLNCRRGFSVQPVNIGTLYTDNGSHMHLLRDTLRFLKMYGRLVWTR
jgi:glycosyltransferase involved in cell wall biosynthesis